MAYEKQNWECGQVITADKLNHMEDGIENAGGECGGKIFQIVGQGTCDGISYYEFDFTYQDVLEAVADGIPCWSHLINGGYALIIYSNPHMVNGVYAADVIFIDPNSVGSNTPRLNSMTVYSDTEDGNLRTYNCWADPIITQ